jgi:YD repeat-containing protein
MGRVFRSTAVAVLAVLALPFAAHAVDRAQCRQYGGATSCWGPVLGPWTITQCAEVIDNTQLETAICRAQGGTPANFNTTCTGLPPAELRRPTSDGDISAYAVDVFTNYFGSPWGTLCGAPSASASSWGGTVNNQFCFTGSGPTFNATFGFEGGNVMPDFPATGQALGSLNTCENRTINFEAIRQRRIGCPGDFGQDQSFQQTSGATPALCSLSFRTPVDPKQDCDSCRSLKVGNPIDPVSGVKRQLEVDYAGTGPQPLRFERLYQQRVYVIDGRQWRHNYSARIQFDTFGPVPVVQAFRASGQVFQFTLSAGQFAADVDINDRVAQLTDAGGALTGWQYREARTDNVETYDAAGNLVAITSRAGLTQTLQYSTAATPPSVAPQPGLLLRVTDAFGRHLDFTYDAIGRLATMQDPAGQTYRYTGNADRHFTGVTYPDGKTRTYVYNEASLAANSFDGRLTGIVDENNSRFASFSYDATGVAFQSEHAGGAQRVTIGYGSWPSAVTVTDALGAVRTYSYTSVNNVFVNTGITQPAASGTGTATSSTSYDANGNAASRTDFNGNRTNYVYDLARNLETSRPEGLTAAGAATPATRTIETQWHPSFQLPTLVTEKDAAGALLRSTATSYDAAGNLLSRTVTAASGLARTWTYTYNANGSILTVDGPRTDVSDVTSYAYYANDDPDPGKRGNVATLTNALGQVTAITAYDALGQPATIVDPNGMITTLVYDPRMRLASRSVGGETTTYAYDGVGQLTQVTLPDGSFLAYSYDAAHRLTGMSDLQGNRIAYTLDAMGNRTQEQVFDPANALAQTRSRVYNNLSRLAQEIGAANQTTSYLYDDQGNVASVTDPLTHVTSNQYDALNRLVRVTDPGTGATQYGYNGIDQLVSVTDPRTLATTYAYDGLGNLNQQQSPDTGATTNTYDAAGNLLTQTDAKGQVTTYAYDALNRVTSIAFSDGSRQAYAYDLGTNGVGRLSQITETGANALVVAQTAYAYDLHGRVTQETRTLAGVAYVTAYQYDLAGRLTGTTYPSGRRVTLNLDALGRVLEVWSAPAGGTAQAVATSVAYRPFGGVKSYTLGNGQAVVRGYDQDGRIASYSLGAQTFAIGYDAASRVSFISDAANPANANTYGYDVLDRLTSAVIPGNQYSYVYDAVGNRTAKTVGANTDTYGYAPTSNRIASITAQAGAVRNFVFDANGSTTDDGTNQYAYDARGRMVRSVGALGTTTYQVNALGQRVRKTNAADDRIFHYDMKGRLIAESDPGGGTKREYIYLNDIPLAVIQ